MSTRVLQGRAKSTPCLLPDAGLVWGCRSARAAGAADFQCGLLEFFKAGGFPKISLYA